MGPPIRVLVRPNPRLYPAPVWRTRGGAAWSSAPCLLEPRTNIQASQIPGRCAMAPLDMKPNELEPYWVPFTPNRAFKKRPRLFAGAKDKHYLKPDGTKVLDATSGLFCV